VPLIPESQGHGSQTAAIIGQGTLALTGDLNTPPKLSIKLIKGGNIFTGIFNDR